MMIEVFKGFQANKKGTLETPMSSQVNSYSREAWSILGRGGSLASSALKIESAGIRRAPIAQRANHQLDRQFS